MLRRCASILARHAQQLEQAAAPAAAPLLAPRGMAISATLESDYSATTHFLQEVCSCSSGPGWRI
jgi:hypothetical protein